MRRWGHDGPSSQIAVPLNDEQISIEAVQAPAYQAVNVAAPRSIEHWPWSAA